MERGAKAATFAGLRSDSSVITEATSCQPPDFGGIKIVFADLTFAIQLRAENLSTVEINAKRNISDDPRELRIPQKHKR